MIEDARKKIKSEMDSNKSNAYIQFVGEFLLQHIEADPDDSEKILAVDKTIANSLNAMKKEAEKKKTGNFAMLTPQEGLEIFLKYFGINTAPAVPDMPVPQKAVKESKPKASFDISLDDLL